MSNVIELPAAPNVPIEGSDSSFPVGRIFCIGKNYAAHAREMGVDPDSESPSIFMKPANSIVVADPSQETTAPYPVRTTNLHHEVELVVALSKGGQAIAAEDAMQHVFGFAVGFDMTRRDMQSKAKEKRHPWAMSKGFDAAAPIGHISPITAWNRGEGRIEAFVDGEPRQAGDLSEMVWSVPNIIAVLSRHLELFPGDLIFTGTPAGVGPVERGEALLGTIEGLTPVQITFV